MWRITNEELSACAELACEANRQYCKLIGEPDCSSWTNLTEEQRDSYIKGVALVLTGISTEAQHSAWMKEKLQNGWIYGEARDEQLKTHPCIKSYHELTLKQQLKDKLFQHVVTMLFDYSRKAKFDGR